MKSGEDHKVRWLQPGRFAGLCGGSTPQAGFELAAVQNGFDPSDWKPMNAVGAGAREIRIHVLGEWRVLYVAKFADAVYVLHAFQKKTQKTRKEDIELAKRRYKQIEE